VDIPEVGSGEIERIERHGGECRSEGGLSRPNLRRHRPGQ
jgi:hypothetical protein